MVISVLSLNFKSRGLRKVVTIHLKVAIKKRYKCSVKRSHDTDQEKSGVQAELHTQRAQIQMPPGLSGALEDWSCLQIWKRETTTGEYF